MAFIDEINIKLSAGDGGDGVVRWRHEKFKEFSGPSGGDGGDGGDVYVKAVRDISRLSHYARFNELGANRGEDGGNNSMTGKTGEDLILTLPLGTVISNKKTEETYELKEDGERILLLKGGKGGLGNEHFKSSTNTTPKESTPGKEGETAEFYLELRLIADVGIIGFPNAGKSTLLNELTKAKSKVGNYQFTTKEPHLGDMYGIILADIPGLIEKASEGKGLGHKFLRHIRRTKLLLHCISLESDDVLADYEIIRKELEQYDPSLSEKPEIIALTKKDSVTLKECREDLEKMKKISGKKVIAVSILEEETLKELKKELLEYKY